MTNILLFVLFSLSFNAFADKNGGVPLTGDTQIIPTDRPGRSATVTISTDPVLSNMLGSSGAVRLQLDPDRVRLMPATEIDVCSIKDELRCEVVTPPVPKDYMDFLSSFSKFKAESADITSVTTQAQVRCGCLTRKLSEGRQNEFNREKEQAIEEAKEKILNAYGRKFINDYSSNVEDMQFFLNKTANMFKDQEAAKAYQCNDLSLYDNAIKATCPNADAAFITNRKKMFINVLTKQDKSFEEAFGKMSEDILSSNVTSELDGSSNGQVFDRRTYDNMRMSSAVDDPKSQFVNKLMTRALQSEYFKTKINEYILKDRTPLEAILKVIEEERNSSEFAKLGLSYEGAVILQTKENTLQAFKVMMMSHPGFLHAMKDRNVFSNLKVAAMRNKNTDLLGLLADQSVIEPVIKDNCSKMVQGFANAVCTEDSKLIASTTPIDLELLLRADEEGPRDQNKLDIKDVLACESRLSNVPQSKKFEGLANLLNTNLRSTSSDYYETQVATAQGGSAKDIGSAFAKVGRLTSGNQMAGARLGQMADRGSSMGVSASGGGVMSRTSQAKNVLAGRSMRVGSNFMSELEARQSIADNHAYENKKNGNTSVAANNASETQVPTQDLGYSSQGAAVTPVAQTAQVPSYVAPQTMSAQAAQSREQLRQYIADKADQQTANEVVAKLDDSSAIELNKLRQENIALLEKSLKSETEKYEEMKKKITDLEQVVPATVAVAPVVEEDERPTRTSLSNLRQSFGEAAQAPRPYQSSRSIASVSGQFSTASGAGAVSSNEPRSQGRGPASVREATPQSAGLTVATITPGLASDVKPQELQQEVARLLSSPTLNQSSLEEIKTKGFLYRYSVVENNETVQKEVLIKFENLDKATQDAITLKLTRKTAENQVSKLEVLRLLIRQQQRI